jgi:hypothetical protein
MMRESVAMVPRSTKRPSYVIARCHDDDLVDVKVMAAEGPTSPIMFLIVLGEYTLSISTGINSPKSV